MKKIIASIIISIVSLSAFANGVFNMQIPQPDFVSNDWDGDNIPNAADPDDDNDGIDDTLDSSPFGGRPGGSSTTTPMELSDNYVVTPGVMFTTNFGYGKDTAGSINNETYELSTIYDIRLYKSSNLCYMEFNLKSGDYNDPVGIKINDKIFNTEQLTQFNLSTYNAYNSFNFKTVESTCDDLMAESTWNVNFIKSIETHTSQISSSASIKISSPYKNFIGTNGPGYSLFGYVAPDYQGGTNSSNQLTVTDNGLLNVSGISLEVKALVNITQPKSGGYGLFFKFICNPLFDGGSAKSLFSIKDGDGNIIVETLFENGYGDVSTPSTSHQSDGINYCQSSAMPSSFVRNTYFGKETSMYHWFD